MVIIKTSLSVIKAVVVRTDTRQKIKPEANISWAGGARDYRVDLFRAALLTFR